MLVAVAAGELPRRPAANVSNKNVQPAVVVEMRISLARIRLVEIARNHDRIAGRVLRLRPRHRRDERDALAVRRPGYTASCAGIGIVGALRLGNQPCAAAVGTRNNQPRLLTKFAVVSEPLPVG